jgi:hypothetical protein
MNKAQEIMLKTYADGDYAWLIEDIVNGGDEETDEYIAKQRGDTLLLFLWRELAEDGFTDNAEVVRRLMIAIGIIRNVADALAKSGLSKNADQ